MWKMYIENTYIVLNAIATLDQMQYIKHVYLIRLCTLLYVILDI
jgi:hypothetical protein